MVEHTIKIPMFKSAYPGCQAVFFFGDALNHTAFADDALMAAKMNLGSCLG